MKYMEAPPVVNASQGTAFVIQGNAVEIVRQDQPICRVPLADLVELDATLGFGQSADMSGVCHQCP